MNYRVFESLPMKHSGRRTRRSPEIENQLLLQFLFNSAPFGFWHWNLKTGALYTDPRCMEIVGYSIHELPGVIEIRQNLILGEDRATVNRIMGDYLAGKRSVYSVDFRLIRKDGTITYVREKGAVTNRDEYGRALNFTGILQELSVEKSLAKLAKMKRP